MKVIEKDILTVKEGFIFQQVNCQGVMGSGIATNNAESLIKNVLTCIK